MPKTKHVASLNIFYFIIVGVVILSLVVFFPRQNQNRVFTNQNQSSANRQNCLGEDCLLVDDLEYPVGELSTSIQDALNEAINDEYKAYSTYEAVIKKFGNVRPFSMIIRAEEQHISSLKAIYDKYGLTTPQNFLSGTITAPATLQQACQIGVEAEIINASLYQDKLLPVVIDYPDIVTVFENLGNASQQKHLPAFEKCQ
jgi:rubrerythrin